MVLGSSLSFSSLIRLQRHETGVWVLYSLIISQVWLREERTFWVWRAISLCLQLSWGQHRSISSNNAPDLCATVKQASFIACVCAHALPECSNIVAGGPANYKAPLWACAPLIDLVRVARSPHLDHTNLGLPLKVVGWSGNTETNALVVN